MPDRPYIHRTRSREAILRNYSQGNPLSDHELAEMLGVKLQSLQVAKSRLRQEGLLPRPGRETQAQRRLAHSVATAAAESIGIQPEAGSATLTISDTLAPPVDFDLDQLAGVQPTTELRRLQWLSWIIENGPLTAKIQAIAKMDDIATRRMGTIGPREPLTLSAVDERLACILVAVGLPSTMRACELAFPKEPPINVPSVPEGEQGSAPERDPELHRPDNRACGIAPADGETPPSGDAPDGG